MITGQRICVSPVRDAVADGSAIYPLPVTPLEYYYLCDDRPDYPAAFSLELTFSGTLSRSSFLHALRASLARHPLLSAGIDFNNGGRPNWISSGASFTVDWAAADEPLSHPDGQQIDLTKATPLRVWVREGRDQTRVSFQFHHAACDALGACQFLEDVLIDYHAQFDEGFTDRLRPLDPALLRARDAFGVLEPNARPSKRDVWLTARHWARLIGRPPSALSAPKTCQPTARRPAVLEFVDHTFDADETRRLRRAAANGATLNDLLLRDLILVLGHWNADHGAGRRLRINLPTNLRSRQDAWLPAANVISFTFIDRKYGRRVDPAKLLESIRRETHDIKRDRTGLLFLGGLGFACGIPGLVPWMLRRRRSFATATLSNLGRLWGRSPLPRRGGKLTAGNVVLEKLTGAPPIRPMTRAGFAVADYGRQISVSLRCDPLIFSQEQSQGLLDRYVAHLRQSIDDGRLPIRKPR